MRCITRLMVAIFAFSSYGLIDRSVDAAPPKTPAGKAGAGLSTAQLLEMARAAKTRFRPLPVDHVAKAKASLLQNIQRVERALRRTSAKNARRWKEYLQWDNMLAELADRSGPNTNRLDDIRERYTQDFENLEKPLYSRVRDDLATYITAVKIAADPNLAEHYQKWLNWLIETLPQYEANPTPELRQQIGLVLVWLESSNQAPAFVAAVRQRYGRPNLYAEVSQRLVSLSMGSEVSEESDVQDCILGTAIFGRAALCGHTQVRLVDNPKSASLEFLLSGVVNSSNVGYNRGVQIFSRGATGVEAVVPVFLDPVGFAPGKATACCDTDSVIDCIIAKSRLVERVAHKRAARSKAQAEQIGSAHAEEQLATRLDERAEKLVAEVQTTYDDKFRHPLLRRGEFPQDMRFRTQQGLLKVVWRQANARQLATATAPPHIPGRHDVAVRLHESMVSNFGCAMIGGVTLTDKRLVELLEKNKIKVPEALRITQDKEPWSITFATHDPVTAVFDDNTVHFAIRGRRFEYGDEDAKRVISKPMEMSAVYQIEKTPDGARFVRQGDVSVDYLDKVVGMRKTDERLMRAVMRGKFEALFAPEFHTTGIALPGRLARAGKLHLEHIAAQTGWLSLCWRQMATKSSEPSPAADSRVAQSN